MLDLLPNEIWSDSSIKILDPACKSWVFLREAAKRFIKWLENEFPNLQERIDHIMTKQLFWIWITNLTALLSRRSLYCSKNAKFDPDDDLWKYSICTKFEANDWNIWFDRVEHERKNWNCIHCGASQSEYERNSELESHAYKFIHSTPEEINTLFGLDHKMRFDVIIWNPPYQLSDWWAWASAKPIYNYFVDVAKKVSPKYLCMIIPARRFVWWKWLDNFRETMINDKNISVLHDYIDASMIFPWVDIKWWVCYFLRDVTKETKCRIFTHTKEKIDFSERYLKTEWSDIFIRDEMQIKILNKVSEKWEKSFCSLVSSRKPYWLASDVIWNEGKYWLKNFSETSIEWWNEIHWLLKLKRVVRYIDKNYNIPNNGNEIWLWKIFIPNAYGCWWIWETIPSPILWWAFIWKPNAISTETFLRIWPFKTENEANNAFSYLKTKFFRLLVWIKKQTQHTSKDTYSFVPMQDFSKPWTDEELYKKYNLSQEEIDYIETMIKPMD